MANIRLGILLTEDFKPVIKVEKENGLIVRGLRVGITDEQNIHIILKSTKGSIREYPLLGLGLVKYIKSQGKEKEIVREAKVQLSLDGYTDKEITFENNQLIIR